MIAVKQKQKNNNSFNSKVNKLCGGNPRHPVKDKI